MTVVAQLLKLRSSNVAKLVHRLWIGVDQPFLVGVVAAALPRYMRVALICQSRVEHVATAFRNSSVMTLYPLGRRRS